MTLTPSAAGGGVRFAADGVRRPAEL